MDYYAAAVREDGTFCRGTDGLLVKGYKLSNGEKIIVMAYCDKENSARRVVRKRSVFLTNWFMEKVGQRTDYVIRMVESCCEELYMDLNIGLVHGEVVRGKEIEDYLEESMWKILKKRRFVKKAQLSVICLYGQKLFAFSNTGRGIFLLGNCDMSEMKGFSRLAGKELMKRRAEVRDSQTIVMGSDSFFENISKDELHVNLCPQMCMDNETMESSLEELGEIARGRNGGRAFSAVALCMAAN